MFTEENLLKQEKFKGLRGNLGNSKLCLRSTVCDNEIGVSQVLTTQNFTGRGTVDDVKRRFTDFGNTELFVLERSTIGDL
jgi:hypothetical protein